MGKRLAVFLPVVPKCITTTNMFTPTVCRREKGSEVMNELGLYSSDTKCVIALAAMGFKIIPIFGIENGLCVCKKSNCKSPGKHPIINWKSEASSVSEQVAKWILQFPNCNWAVVTGCGLGVLDIDRKSGGIDSLIDLESKYGPLPTTPISLTGGGGRHYFFKYSDMSLRNTAGTIAGIDFRGDGGIIIVPPSKHLSGEFYKWDNGKSFFEIELAEIPHWLIDQLTNRCKPKKNLLSSAPREKVIEGSRNDSLFRMACSLRARGNSDEFILTTLVAANIELCTPPLEDDELLAVANNAAKYHVPKNIDSYFVENGCTFRNYFDRKGEVHTQELCNFESRITAEEIYDNGLEQNRIFSVDSKTANGRLLNTVRIPASEFSSLSWVLPQLGGDAIIYPVSGAAEHFRTAIQSLSLGHPVIIKYIHLGWRNISGKYHFLHSSGAITEDGMSSNVSVSTDEGRLTDFALPVPPLGDELPPIVRTRF